jgi:hypothetical protein
MTRQLLMMLFSELYSTISNLAIAIHEPSDQCSEKVLYFLHDDSGTEQLIKVLLIGKAVT